ncbi:hypothetical protein DNTS_033192 [Danionella cerebrum]|uniref:TIR domain-containing protein n=1 Tax=Danionella cerebrum TaxID=2873325 RepID=A0A553NKV2_9TELE|nr:hypothetical protein DNTS_033192 [Danionella translucida]
MELGCNGATFRPTISLFLLLNHVHHFASLHPQFYPCGSHSTKDGHVVVDCKHRKLAQIPKFASLAVISLNLNENHISHVKAEDFLDLPNLKHLSLEWNCVSDNPTDTSWPSCRVDIDPDAFVGLRNLISLRLAGNSLKDVPPLPQQLVTLGLELNNIFNISKPLGTPKLKQLLLNKNCFYANPCYRPYIIDPAVFQDLPELSNLTLSNNNVTTVPPNLPVSLESLDLRQNKIENITKESFAKLRHLRHLNLGWNCQRCDHASDPCFPCRNNQPLTLHQDAFLDQNDSLLSLNLQGNSIRKLPRHLFSRLHKLKELDLSSNFLAYAIRNGTFFQELKAIVSLSLVYNYEPEVTFPELVLSPSVENMRSLKHLYLSGLFFRILSERSLAPLLHLPRLESLDLRMNSICDVSLDALRSLSALKKLDISQNRLAFNPCFSTCQSLPLHQTLENHHTHTGMPAEAETRYQTLGNFHGTIPSDAKSQYKRFVKHSDLNHILGKCHGPLEDVPNYQRRQHRPEFPKYIESHNNYKKSPFKTGQKHQESHPVNSAPNRAMQEPEAALNFSMWHFKKQICSKSLHFDLSQNNIPWLNASTFQGMGNVVCLDLSYNYISQTLNGEQFSPLSSVAYLNMAYNRIDLYSDKCFLETSATLTALDLSNNEFHFVMKGMGHSLSFLANMASLKVLSLANNHIGMRMSTIPNSTSLKYLIFSGNRLDIMWNSWRNQYLHFFQGLTNLTYLDISENRLKTISPEALVNFPLSLRALRVDLNMLTHFPWANASVLQQLCYLNLSSNLLSYLPNTNFDLRFVDLDLSHNQLVVIPKAFLSRAVNLKNLRLNNNQLKILDIQALPVSFHGKQYENRSSGKLALHGNPFTCSCVISQFAKFLRETDLYIPYLTTQVHCGFPQSLAGVSLLSVELRSCQDMYGGVSYLCTSLLVVAATVIPLLKHLYGWDLWYLIQIWWTGHKGHSAAQGNVNENQFDAFVVFDTDNKAVREWIYKEMVMRLENRGRWQFSLCLEERDWLAGVSCIENLHKSVYNSRKTVFVLNGPSGRAQTNGVVRQAFLMVQQRLLDEKLDVAIHVWLDPLFPKFKYLQMRKRLCKKSVLSWPRNPRMQPLFWNNLRVAIVSDNVRSYDKKVTESFV